LNFTLIVLYIVASEYLFELFLLLVLFRRYNGGTFCVNLFQKFLLSVNIVLFNLAEGLNRFVPNIKTSMQWKPLKSCKEFSHQLIDLLVVANSAQIYFNIILLDDAHRLKVSILYIQTTAFFGTSVRSLESLGAFITVIEIKPLKPVDRVFHIILPLGILLSGLYSDSLEILLRNAMMSPSQEQFVFLVLKLVVFPPKKVS
jgi:hypothetical protein